MSKMERVHLDFLGPLPESTSGNTNVLVMMDQFTEWVECKPLISQTAEVTARAAVNEFFLHVLVSRYVKCSKFTKVALTHTDLLPTVRLRDSTEPSWMRYGISLVNHRTVGMNTCRSLLMLSDHLSTEIQVSHQTSSCLDVKLTYQQI